MEAAIAKYKSFLEHFNIRETLSYTWVGIVGVLLDAIGFAIIRSIFDLDPVIITTVSAMIAAALTFPLNAKFTFLKSDNLYKRFQIYIVINLLGVMLGAAIMFFGHDLVGIDDRIVKAVSVVFVAGTQFLLNKFIAFK